MLFIEDDRLGPWIGTEEAELWMEDDEYGNVQIF